MDTVSVGCAVLVSLEEKSSVGATVVSGVAMRCALSRAANPSGVRGTSEERFKKNDDANGKQYHSDKEDAADNGFRCDQKMGLPYCVIPESYLC